MASRKTNQIPQPPKLRVWKIMNQADSLNGLLPIESQYTDKIGYVLDKQDFLIVTEENGFLRMPKCQMQKVLKEALECMEVLK